MKYNIKAHPTTYKDVLFRSRLEARWAAFFDLVDWRWEYEPIDLKGWSPDFRVSFFCGHSECPNGHNLLVEVKPYFSIEDFNNHACMDYPFGSLYPNGIYRGKDGDFIPADASAAFGIGPHVVYWEMGHGSGGITVMDLSEWIDYDVDLFWKRAGEIVQYRKAMR